MTPHHRDIQPCPTCEGTGRVVDLQRNGPNRRQPCTTCEATGRIDAGVWPYSTAKTPFKRITP